MNAPSASWAARTAAAITSALLLLALLPGSAQAAALQVVLRAEDGGTAVEEGDALRVGGTAPRDGVVEAAHVVAVGTAGQDVDRRPLSEGARNGSSDRAVFVRVDGEALSGRFVLDCAFAADNTLCLGADKPVRGVVLEVTVDGVTSRSNEVPLDNVDPVIARHEVVTPRTVRVVFSEVVADPDGDDPADFRVRHGGQDQVVTGVSAGEGECRPAGPDRLTPPSLCTRDLALAVALPEDAVPEVLYDPALLREGYADRAGNTVDRGRSQRAPVLDRVRPAVPRIDSVGGSAPAGTPATSSSSETAPAVVVSGLTVGHEVRVLVTPGAGEPLDSGWQRVTSSRQTVPARLPLGEAAVLVTAEARDPGQNVSSESGKQPARADQGPNPVRYVLDAGVPLLLGARAGQTQDVEVSFSEVVTGSDDPADWTITTPDGRRVLVVAVTGSGDRRTLDTLQPVPQGSAVAYRPAPTSTRYRDAAGNAVPDAVLVLGAVAVPVVLDPTGPVLTRVPSYTVRGTAPAGTEVRLYTDQGDDGDADGAPLQTRALEPGQTAFAFEVPLARNTTTDLVVTARDREGLESGPAPVARLTHDDLPPTITLTRPQGGEVYAGGSEQQAVFDYRDSNPGAVRGELLLDGAVTLLSPGAAPDGAFRYRLPLVSSEDARLRVTPRDAAGNEGAPVTSPPFVVDAEPPAFSAVTVDARTVRVRFSEPRVTGSSTALDWQVDGEQVSSASQTSEDGVVVVRLTTGPRTTVEPDEEPRVVYAPSTVSDEYRDRASQTVVRRQVLALDRILPAAPSVTAPTQAVLTREASQRVAGRATAGDAVELLDPAGRRAAGPVAVAADGGWALDVPLARDSVNDLRAASLDRHGNRSAAAAPVVRLEQDGTDPVVAVTEPRGGTRVEPGQRVTVRWSSSDRNLQDGATLVEASTDGGATWTTVAERQPASGTATWTVPSTVTPDARLRVSTPDRAGRTGRATAGPLGIGTAPAASPSPSGTATPTGTAAPSPSSTAPALPPLQVAVPDDSVVPGETVPVSVSGAPGTRVELRAYSRPRTTYATARTGVLDGSGRLVWSVRPGTNTRLFVRDVDGRQGDSRSAVVNVRTALSLTVVRNGRRDYTFQGRILPRRAGQLITLYRVERDGRRVITAQLRTDSTGTYRLRRVFTGSGRFGFLTRTGANLTNAAGESNEGRTRPTDVF